MLDGEREGSADEAVRVTLSVQPLNYFREDHRLRIGQEVRLFAVGLDSWKVEELGTVRGEGLV